MDEYKPLPKGYARQAGARPRAGGRSLHSSTFRLNMSVFCGIGGAFRNCLGGVQEVSMGIRGYLGYTLCHKRLRLRWKEDECKPLAGGEVRQLGLQRHHGGGGRGDGVRQHLRQGSAAHVDRGRAPRLLPGTGVFHNKHSGDVESPPPPPPPPPPPYTPCVCMNIHPEVKPCSDLGSKACSPTTLMPGAY